MQANLETLLAWGEPKKVTTRNGERNLRVANCTEAFRALWRSNKAQLKEAGISWEVDRRSGELTGRICWWQPISAAQVAAEAQADAESRATDADIEIPAPKGLEYLPYQKAGISFALKRPSTLFGDEMGLGKTIQAIGLINADVSIKRVLVICPASLKLNWRNEFKRWSTRPELRLAIANGAFPFPSQAEIVVINYDILVKHQAAIDAQSWDLLIADEAHFCKSPKAKRSMVTHAIKATRRVYLTGTPLPNRPIELWPLISALDPVRWNKKSFWRFARRYCAAVQGAYGWDLTGASHLDELQKELRQSIMVRRLKRDVLTELPPKVRQIVELPVDAEAREALEHEIATYEARQDEIEKARAERDVLQAGLNGGDRAAYEAAAARLRDLVNAAFSELAALRHTTALAKLPEVIRFLESQLDSGDNKIVVFAHHRDVVDGLVSGLAEFNPVKLVGGMNTTDKDAAVRAFQNDPACRVFIGNIQAAGVGITLTAASHVAFAELDWVPANLSQAEDRCHRIGQRDSVLVQHLVLDGSLDARMVQRVIDKQRIADAALDNKAEQKQAPEAQTILELSDAPEVAAPAQQLSQSQIDLAHQAVRMIAGICDGARELDNVGFAKFDTHLGKSLAAQATLSPKQGALAMKLARKYRRQLPAELVEALGVGAK